MNIEKLDAISLELHRKLLAGEISLEEYGDAFDKMEPEIRTSRIKTNIFYRADRRTLGQWAIQIVETTIREKNLITEFFDGSGAIIQDYGVANSGVILFGTKPNFGKPDFLVTIDGKTYPVEFKFNPSFKKATFKVVDLNNYAQHKSLILMICENSGIRKWEMYDGEDIEGFLQLPVKNYWEVGGKPAIQLTGKKLYLRHWKDRSYATQWWTEDKAKRSEDRAEILY